MTTLTDNFEELLRSKKIPLKKNVIQKGQILYNGNFRLSETQSLPFGIVFDSKDNPVIDYQITYHRLAYVADYSKREAVLDLINELNQLKSGYYTVCLGGDGEIYLKLLGRTSDDILPVYEMMVFGSSIAKALLPEISQVLDLA